jgi:hypothetical protein
MLIAQLSLEVLLLIQAQQAPTPQHKVFIPTSEAVDIARQVARDQGYSIANNDVYFFDLMMTEAGKPALSGYVTLGFYGNSNLLNQISINESTGQVVDGLKCIVFEYPDLMNFQQELRRETGARPLSPAQLANSIGCESLKRLGKPVHKVPRPH